MVIPPYHKGILHGYSDSSKPLGYSRRIWRFLHITGAKQSDMVVPYCLHRLPMSLSDDARLKQIKYNKKFQVKF